MKNTVLALTFAAATIASSQAFANSYIFENPSNGVTALELLNDVSEGRVSDAAISGPSSSYISENPSNGATALDLLSDTSEGRVSQANVAFTAEDYAKVISE